MLELKSTSVKKDNNKKSNRKDMLKKYNSPSESFRHRIIKQLFYKAYHPDANRSVQACSLEKSFDSRRADIYVKFKSGKEMVVEVQSSKISAKEIETRTKDYTKRGIYALWVLDGNGSVVGSKKQPERKKNIVVSHIEKILHSMYQGRVYYSNVIERKNKSTVTIPYALYFAPTDKYHSNGFNVKYEIYYARNSHFAFIQNYNEPLLIKNKNNGYLIARFCDRNLKQQLITELTRYLYLTCSKVDLTQYQPFKKFVLGAEKLYGNLYGKIFVLECLSQIATNQPQKFNRQVIENIRKKRFKKLKNPKI